MNKKPYQSPDMEIWQTEPIHLLTVSHQDTDETLPISNGEDNEDGEWSTGDSF